VTTWEDVPATINAVREIFVSRVIESTTQIPSALQNLQALGHSWMDYLEADRFAGGCFLCAASAELDDRPGSLRDEVVATMGEWVEHPTMGPKSRRRSHLQAVARARAAVSRLSMNALKAFFITRSSIGPQMRASGPPLGS
jgi:Tetracyclin repressor-like, C-terminal domain